MARTSSAVTAALADAGEEELGTDVGVEMAVLLSMREGGEESAKMDVSSS